MNIIHARDRLENEGRVVCPYCEGQGTLLEEHSPVETDALKMLEFLAERMEYAGVSEAVASSYAKDIRDILSRVMPSEPASEECGVCGEPVKSCCADS